MLRKARYGFDATWDVSFPSCAALAGIFPELDFSLGDSGFASWALDIFLAEPEYGCRWKARLSNPAIPLFT